MVGIFMVLLFAFVVPLPGVKLGKINLRLEGAEQDLFCSYGVMFPCFFMFPTASHWHLHAGGCSHLFCCFCTGFSGERLSLGGGWEGTSWIGWASFVPEKALSRSFSTQPNQLRLMSTRLGRGLPWPRLQRSCRWQWRVELLASLGVKVAGFFLFFFAHGRKF